MLAFAAICPHPPLLIPAIGGDEIREVKDTSAAMRLLASEIARKEIDTIAVISPHGTVFMDQMSVNLAERLTGNFSDFGSDIRMDFRNDSELAMLVKEIADANKLPLQTVSEELDHGAMVPLFFLGQELPDMQVCHLSFSYLDYSKHFSFGEILFEAIQDIDRRVALIASGDLSHRLTPQAPAGYSPRGQEFDSFIISCLEKNETEKILNIDSRLVEDAGECGLRSIIILLGALAHTDCHFEKLSYEGPFGVGYLVGRFTI